MAGFPFVACVTVVERLGPSHPRSLLVAAEPFSSSVDCMQSNSYSNQDLDYGLLHGATRPRFDAARTTFYLPLRQRGVGRGLERDPFSERADSAGEL